MSQEPTFTRQSSLVAIYRWPCLNVCSLPQASMMIYMQVLSVFQVVLQVAVGALVVAVDVCKRCLASSRVLPSCDH